ncbi:MAG: hypothetical protein Q8O15_00940 [Rectinemataceae bacterium]|nr:hypothetical protein [Rectinemataceae bacterium]
MKFADIVRLFGDKAWFDFEMVLLLSGEAAPCVHTALYRLRESGKIVELRRGLFTLAEPWRHRGLGAGAAPAFAASLSAAIYPPSYLSGRWVLEACGALRPAPRDQGSLPEFSAVTARPAKVFENSFGRYSYDTLPRDLLFGAMTKLAGGERLRLAFPEKALLDFCFLQGGDWDEARFEAEGFSTETSDGRLNLERLGAFAARAGRPRLARAAEAFARLAAREGASL